MENTYTPLKEALSSQGKSFSQENLNALAKSSGINNFQGTDAQNRELATMLKKTTPTSNATVSNATITPIALNNLNTQAVNIPVTPVSTQTQPVAPVNMANDILQRTQVEDGVATKSASNLSMALASLVPELQGQAQATAEAERIAGKEKFAQELQGINNQILAKTAEINQDDIKLMQSLQTIEDKPVAMEFISGEQSSVQRNANLARALKQAEIGVLNARAIGTQGNLQLAIDTAKQAVDLKYAPIRETIATYEAQLKALAPLLSVEEKKQAREQEIRTKLAFNEIEQKQENEKKREEMIIKGINEGAPADLIARANKAKTPGEVAGILGARYGGDYFKTELLRAQIDNQKADAAEKYAKINALKGTDDTNTKSLIKYPKGISETTQRQFQDRYSATQSITQELNKYKNLVDTYGNMTVLPGEAKEALAGQKGILTALVKDTMALGTLDSGVLTLVDQMVGSTGVNNAFIDKKVTIDKIDNLNRTFNSQLKNKADTLGVQYQDLPSTIASNVPLPPKEEKEEKPSIWQQSLGALTQKIPGTSIMGKTNSDGTFNFIIPTSN